MGDAPENQTRASLEGLGVAKGRRLGQPSYSRMLAARRDYTVSC